MTSRQITISQIHHRKYLNNEPLDEDPCCPACYPVLQTPPPQFIELWNWISITLCPAASRFNQNTIDAFETAELLRQQLTRNNLVTAENRTVLVAYQRIFETVLYRRSPAYIPSDLAYFTLVSNILTGGFYSRLTRRELTQITAGRIPPTAPREIVPLLRIIQTAWVAHAVSRQGDNEPILLPVLNAEDSPSQTYPNTPNSGRTLDLGEIDNDDISDILGSENPSSIAPSGTTSPQTFHTTQSPTPSSPASFRSRIVLGLENTSSAPQSRRHNLDLLDPSTDLSDFNLDLDLLDPSATTINPNEQTDESILFGEGGSTLNISPFITNRRDTFELPPDSPEEPRNPPTPVGVLVDLDTPPEPASILFLDQPPSIFENLPPPRNSSPRPRGRTVGRTVSRSTETSPQRQNIPLRSLSSDRTPINPEDPLNTQQKGQVLLNWFRKRNTDQRRQVLEDPEIQARLRPLQPETEGESSNQAPFINTTTATTQTTSLENPFIVHAPVTTAPVTIAPVTTAPRNRIFPFTIAPFQPTTPVAYTVPTSTTIPLVPQTTIAPTRPVVP